MADIKSLHNYPALAEWYEKIKNVPLGTQPLYASLAIQTCAILRTPPSEELLQEWLETLSRFFTTSTNLRHDFLTLSGHFHDLHADFHVFLGDFAHIFIELGLGDNLLSILQLGAHKTGIATLGFLSAWTALNCNKHQQCIEECERIDEPFAPVFGLQGQAYLELGKLPEAIEALEIATKLDPHDAHFWFQKAKAQHVAGKSVESFATLKICEALAPLHNEVSLFMAMVALEIEEENHCKELAWASLRPHLTAAGHAPFVSFTLLKLALQLNDKEKAKDVVVTMPTVLRLETSKEIKFFSGILRNLQQKEWMDLAAHLLHKTEYGKAV